MGKGKRRALGWLACIVAVLVILILAVPLWFPWVLTPVAKKNGLRYSNYSRHGYGRFGMSSITYTNADVQFTAREAQFPVPTLWVWKCFKRSPSRNVEFARVQGWTLSFSTTNEPSKAATKPSSPYTNLLEVQKVVQNLRQWLPKAELVNGEVIVGTNVIRLPNASWDRGIVNARLDAPALKQKAAVHAELTPYLDAIHVESQTAHATADATILPNAQGIDISINGAWKTNALSAQVHFNKEDPLPETARVAADHVQIPGVDLGLADYGRINGSAEVNWTNGHFICIIAAKGIPRPSSTNMPPVTVNVRAAGDTNVATIESAQIDLPWLQIRASPDVRLHFHDSLLQEPANVTLNADLNRQHWVALHGLLHGTARLEPSGEKYPQIFFNLSGSNVGSPQIEGASVGVTGTTRWPEINVERATAVLDDGSSLSAIGRFNYSDKTIANGHLTFTGPAAARWLPAGYGYKNGSLSVAFSGPTTNLLYEGRLAVTNLTAANVGPMQVQLAWKGQQLAIKRATARVNIEDTQIDTTLSLSVVAPATTNSHMALECDLESLSCKQPKTNLFTLQHSSRISFTTISSNQWHARIEPIVLEGDGGRLNLAGEIDWPNRGVAQFGATNVGSEKLPLRGKWHIEPTTLRRLEFTGGWTNGPLIFAVSADAETKLQNRAEPQRTNRFLANLGDLGTISVHLAAHGDGQAIVLTNFLLQAQTSTIAVARGFIPVSLLPASGTNAIQINPKAPAEFSMATESNSIFWRKFSDWTGITLREPSVQADMTGTWESPRGAVQIKAAEIRLPEERFKVPDLQALDVSIGLDRESATLTNLSFLIQKQPVRATGRVPLGESFWADLKTKQLPNWNQASGRLQISDAQIAAFSGFFPALLAPQGTFHLDAQLAPGGKLAGALSLKDARTRPLANLGPIRDIDVSLGFSNHELRLAEADVTIGGSPVKASGTADLTGTDWLRGARPPFEFSLSGTNVPLSRRPESIIRSDLRVTVKHTNGAPPLISGFVRLHDSYYLSDLTALVPGKQASPEQRPPYFSITETNLADWRLALHVGGDRGLRVRSTIFVGKVSPNLRLQGTLREPVALGDVKIDSGTIKFPFANLDVQRGYVTLTSENPYRPQLMVSASSKNYGYDVRMDVTGPADQPVIQFSSTPALSSEQLVLMVTAGELPKTGYTLTPSQRAQTMALFLGKDMLNKLGFGDQSEDRLTFNSGEEISETGRSTYSLEYKLTPRWSLVGEYDRFNAFNAGVKWKVYSK